MLFTQIEYFFFFILFVAVYLGAPHRYIRHCSLLAFSYYFYGFWNPKYLVLIVITTLANFLAALWIEHRRQSSKLALTLAALISLGILGVFKYYNFFIDNVNLLAPGAAFRHLEFLLPVGISFFTFQALAYTIDVYRREIQAEKNLLHFASFISFFPQLVAGPIERAKNLLPQIKKKKPQPTFKGAVSGIHWILYGLFKKLVVADNIAPLVDSAYSSVESQSGLGLLVGTYLFAVQIYCDFSGYCDIAVGSARCVGINLMENFRTPYVSKSFSEFWTRWHISLSRWFRDYVYIPLGGSRVSNNLFYRNILITFALSGFWHGAQWTFVIWGILHSSYLLIEKKIRETEIGSRIFNPKSVLTKSLLIFVVFNFVCLAWVFFRADSAGDALLVVWKIASFAPGTAEAIAPLLQSNADTIYLVLGSILALIAIDSVIKNDSVRKFYWSFPGAMKFATLFSVALAILFLGAHGSRSFIYFQF